MFFRTYRCHLYVTKMRGVGRVVVTKFAHPITHIENLGKVKLLQFERMTCWRDALFRFLQVEPAMLFHVLASCSCAERQLSWRQNSCGFKHQFMMIMVGCESTFLPMDSAVYCFCWTVIQRGLWWLLREDMMMMRMMVMMMMMMMLMLLQVAGCRLQGVGFEKMKSRLGWFPSAYPFEESHLGESGAALREKESADLAMEKNHWVLSLNGLFSLLGGSSHESWLWVSWPWLFSWDKWGQVVHL